MEAGADLSGSDGALKKEKRYPVYLIVADGTDEFGDALRYVGRSALLHKARVAVLYVIPENDVVFMPWKAVSDDLQENDRLQAEFCLQKAGGALKDYGLTPSLYLRSGRIVEVVRDLVNGDKSITKLVLAGNSQGGDPGPLVSYFTGRGLSEINVPVTVVPSHLDDETFAHFFEQID